MLIIKIVIKVINKDERILNKVLKVEYSGKFVKIERKKGRNLAINAIDEKDEVKDEDEG